MDVINNKCIYVHTCNKFIHIMSASFLTTDEIRKRMCLLKALGHNIRPDCY